MSDLNRDWPSRLSPPMASPSLPGQVEDYDRRRRVMDVLLVDSRPLSRDSISFHVHARAPDMRVFPCSLPADIDRAPHLHEVDLAVLNIGSARIDDPATLPQVTELKKRLPDVPLAVLTDHAESKLVVAGLRMGLRGYITSDVDVDVMVGALRLICSGGTFVPATSHLVAGDVYHEDVPAAQLPPDLTPRQRQVLTRLRLGKTNKVIAYELNMCESTVKVHIRHIMRRLGASNRTEAVYLAQARLPPEL